MTVLLVYASAGGQEVTARLAPGTQLTVGQPIDLDFDPDAVHLFDPETGERLSPTPGP